MLKKALLSAAVAGPMLAMVPGALAAPIVTDIVSVIDESGSMGGEQAWLSGMISQLDGGLSTAAGADPLSVQYGLVGFGARVAPVRSLIWIHLRLQRMTGVQLPKWDPLQEIW